MRGGGTLDNFPVWAGELFAAQPKSEASVILASPVLIETYVWSPSHDQRGMLRPLGTSLADFWYLAIVVVVAQAK
jgi:hypothetical protein